MPDVELESSMSAEGVLTTPLAASLSVASAMSGGGTLIASLAAAVSLAMSGTATASISGLELMLNPHIQSDFLVEADATFDFNIENYSFQSLPVVRADLEASLTIEKSFGVVAECFMAGDFELGIEMELQVLVEPSFAMTVEFDRGRDALGVREVIDEILWLWGIESSCYATDFLKQRAINDLNAALQMLWSQSKEVDYWTRTTLTIPFGSGVNFAVLTDNIQSVIGTATIAGKPLTAVMTRGEFTNFVHYYLGGYSVGEPIAYYIDRTSQSVKDAAKCTMRITPAPLVAVDVDLDVVLEAPRYTWSDYRAWETIPMPHRYVETLLIPIARYRAMSFQHFIRPERAPMIEREYLEAMAQLGLNDPMTTREEARTQ